MEVANGCVYELKSFWLLSLTLNADMGCYHFGKLVYFYEKYIIIVKLAKTLKIKT